MISPCLSENAIALWLITRIGSSSNHAAPLPTSNPHDSWNQIPRFPFQQAPTFEEIPFAPETPGLLVTNELIDAFPVHSLIHRGGQWMERRVGGDGSSARWQEETLRDHVLQEWVAHWPDSVPDEWIMEARPDQDQWLETVRKFAPSWEILICDYGFTDEERLDPGRT
jgi:SAM-dependent MidA family methyltransferase